MFSRIEDVIIKLKKHAQAEWHDWRKAISNRMKEKLYKVLVDIRNDVWIGNCCT